MKKKIDLVIGNEYAGMTLDDIDHIEHVRLFDGKSPNGYTSERIFYKTTCCRCGTKYVLRRESIFDRINKERQRCMSCKDQAVPTKKNGTKIRATRNTLLPSHDLLIPLSLYDQFISMKL